VATAPVGYVSTTKIRGGPDSGIVKEQLQWLQHTLKVMGQEDFCKFFFWILIKKEDAGNVIPLPSGFWNRRLVPFFPNRPQRDMINREKNKNICLKYRQGGYTTDKIIRRLYLPAITEPGSGCLLVSQNHFYAAQHFAILKRTHKFVGTSNPYDPKAMEFTNWLHQHLLHTANSNRREIIFDQLDSKILVDSAEQEEVGQGLTLSHVVCTEVARWPGKPEDTLANMKEAIPDNGTLDMESTANGYGGYFFEECMRARDPQNKNAEFNYFFHEWWWHDEYRAQHVEESMYKIGDQYLNIDKLTDEEERLVEAQHLDLAQIGFRRLKKESLRHNFDEKYPEDDITCFLVSGNQFFDRDILRYRLIELMNYSPMLEKRDGEFMMFHKPLKGRRYIIGADTATGRTVTTANTDFSAAAVIDEQSGEEMAALHGRIPPEHFADDLIELAEMYNGAMIAVERGTGGDGGVVLYRLEEERYWNIYKHRDRLRSRAVDAVKKKETETPGLPMTPKTRPVCCNRLRAFMESYPEKFHDRKFIEEALVFARDEKGTPRGGGEEDNAHDDRVMCRAIAHFVRLVNLGHIDPLMVKKEKYGQEETPEDEAAGEAA